MTGFVSTMAASADPVVVEAVGGDASALRLTPEQFKLAMGSFAAGVTVVTGLDVDGTPQGMTATAFTSLSLTPPQCLVCVNRHARAHAAMVERRRFAVNILRDGQQSLSSRFASPILERFAGVAWSHGHASQCPIFTSALAWIECRVVEVHGGGDHNIIIGEMLSVHVNDGTPLVYFRGGYSALSNTSSESRARGDERRAATD